jgi:peptidoglycan/xylan/chitin deacetylase (PgdA/CDA1 family)
MSIPSHNQKKILLWLGTITVGLILLFIITQPHPVEQTVLISHSKLSNHAPHLTENDRAPIPLPYKAIKLGSAIKLPILMYHHIDSLPPELHDAVRKGLTITPEDFETQVAWIKKQGYTSITLDNLYQFAQKKSSLPKKPIIFTFDDGYQDVFQYAVPILKKYGFMGSFAIITDFPGTISGTNTYATWEQIAAAKDNNMEIVCHTENHFDGSNPKFTADFIYQNISGCQQTLTSHLQSAEPYLVYPYGHYTPVYLEQAKKAGFVMGLTVHEGNTVNLENLMEIPRVRVNPGEKMDVFEKRLVE